jgi:hypothetical protein
VPTQIIDLRANVDRERARSVAAARQSFEDTLSWLIGKDSPTALHRVDDELWPRLMALGAALVSVWLAFSLPRAVPASFQAGRAWYGEMHLGSDIVRSRFGQVWLTRPVYRLVHGQGHAVVAPPDRRIGLAAGRMSLSVHLLTAWLAAQLPFDGAVDVASKFSGYAVSKRSALGIVDLLGPVAAAFQWDLPTPDDDGDILVIQVDGKGAPMMTPEEHGKRRRPHKKRVRGQTRRGLRRLMRKEHRKRHRKDCSKNAKMAMLGIVYTLKTMPDGLIEGPYNKRVFGTFDGGRALFRMLAHEARKRGYDNKRTLFLADGAHAIWNLQKEFFPEATPCLDWFHLTEYLWQGGGTVHREEKALEQWLHARKDELREGRIDAVLEALEALRAGIGKSGPGTKGRRKRLNEAIRYFENHKHLMPYAELLKDGLDVGTGAMEGAVKHVAGARLDGSGMRWSPQRAGHVLALRCVLVNGDWESFAETAARRHEALVELCVPRVTPDKPTVPHLAERKAA